MVLDGLEFALRISGASASQAARVARFEPLGIATSKDVFCASSNVAAKTSHQLDAANRRIKGSRVSNPATVMFGAQQVV